MAKSKIDAKVLTAEITDDLNKLALKLQHVPEFKVLRGLSAAYDEGEAKYSELGLLNREGHQMVGLIMLKELVRRVTTGENLGAYDNTMLNSYFVSDEEMGSAPSFDDYY